MDIRLDETEARPFLSILTRCFRRPKALGVNIKSVDSQSDQDFEHLLFWDRKRVGIAGANKSFFNLSSHVRGEWIYLMDDDDFLVHQDFVKDLKEIVRDHNPELIMVKAEMSASGRILPEPWKGPPVLCKVSTLNFVVCADVWKKHIVHFGSPSAGDFSFINRVWKHKPRTFWWDKLVARAPTHAGGSPEPRLFDKIKHSKLDPYRGVSRP